MKTASKYLYHTSCSKCGSSDANAVFDDNHSYCYACNTYNPCFDEDEQPTESVKLMTKISSTFEEVVKAIPSRNITRQTCETFKVSTDGLGNIIQPYYNNDGQEVGQKVKSPTKDFMVVGDIKKAILFGQQLFPKGGKYVTIYEGELDCLAGYQMTGSKWPSVSIKNGAAAALKNCKEQYEWLDSFENIVICFDADEPGQKAAKEVAELFGTKAKVFKHSQGYKDACDYLKDNKGATFVDLWWRAEEYRPDGIINAKDLWEELKKPQAKPDAHWPYNKLDDMLCGLRKRELITIAAGTGQGKSTFLRQLIHHLLKTTNDNVGMAFLEESATRTALGIMSIEAQKPLHLPTTMYTEQEKQDAFNNTFGSGRCVMFNHFGSLEIDSVLSRLRWMAKGQNCSWIILDHYQMILSGMDTDERKGLDMLLTKLRTFVEETGVGLFGVSHTRRMEGARGLENGAEITLSALRGTQGISQLSDAVIGLQRDQQHEDELVRNTTEVKLLKSRFTGETGPAGYLYFDKATNKLVEVDKPQSKLEEL